MTQYIVTVYRDVRYVRDVTVEASSAEMVAQATDEHGRDLATQAAGDAYDAGWMMVDSAVTTGIESIRRADGQPLDEYSSYC